MPHSDERSASARPAPSLGDLRAFCAVADHGSISAAARVLGEAKGSVSRRIARLEEATGAALLTRVGGRATPTAEGLAYRRRVGEALELLEVAQEELAGRSETPSGHLRITTLQGLGTSLLAAPLGRFLARFPSITVELVVTERVLSFREDGIDLAIRPALGPLPDSGHIATPLAAIRVGLVASPAYLAAHPAPTHPHELVGHRLLLPPAWGGGIALRLQPRGRPSEALEVGLQGHLLSHDTEVLREAARAGGGIALVLHGPLVDEGLVPVLPDWESVGRGHLVLLRPAGPASPKVQAFVDHMRAEFGAGGVANSRLPVA